MTTSARKCPELPEPAESAGKAGLRHVSDDRPGIRRIPCGSGFRYVGPGGQTIRDPRARDRFRSLAIPPAWREVWICPDPLGHLQATGRDEKGRKQYRYHPRWRLVRDESKYARMVTFGISLGRLRGRIERDLRRPGLLREKVLAAVVRLLEESLIRVGNDDYRRRNRSFGLTTMRDRHVSVDGSSMRFRFRGKSGVVRDVELDDPRLARIVRRCQELPGQDLFQYVDEDGSVVDVGSTDVNAYLRESTGHDFSAKDFRTWAGTVLAAEALRECDPGGSAAESRRNVVRAIEHVADRLGNTPAVCRKCYVHPAVIDAYLDGSINTRISSANARRSRLSQEEALVLALLRDRSGGRRREKPA